MVFDLFLATLDTFLKALVLFAHYSFLERALTSCDLYSVCGLLPPGLGLVFKFASRICPWSLNLDYYKEILSRNFLV